MKRQFSSIGPFTSRSFSRHRARTPKLSLRPCALLMLLWLVLGGESVPAAANYEPSTFTHFAGTLGGLGYSDGTGRAARFQFPSGVAVDASGNVYVADNDNHTIRKITPGGVVSTLAGMAASYGSADGTGSAARFYWPFGVAADAAGNVYVADQVNSTIHKGWVAPRVMIAPDGSGGFLIRVHGTANLSYRLQRAETLNGPWTTSAPHVAPASGLVEFQELLPPPGQAFYRALQE